MELTIYFLNTDGINCNHLIVIENNLGQQALSSIFSSVLLRAPQGHRIRRQHHSKSSLNGDDVTLVMKDICLLLQFILKEEFMKDIFFEHLSKLSFIKKNKLIELGFNVDDKQQGKTQIIILYYI
jgi:hypothetical protein